jgi:hypothetical protein
MSQSHSDSALQAVAAALAGQELLGFRTESHDAPRPTVAKIGNGKVGGIKPPLDNAPR